jgi:hypothetical protein
MKATALRVQIGYNDRIGRWCVWELGLGHEPDGLDALAANNEGK